MPTLLEKLQTLHSESSKTTLREWIKGGRVFVDGTPITHPNTEIDLSQEVSLQPKPKPHIYEDKHLVVVDKPAGLLSVATDVETANSMHRILKKRHQGKVYVVHRLDRDTSGVILFAYSQEAFQKLKEELKERKIKRTYFALVEGHPGEGTWDFPLTEDENYYVHVDSQGERAVTHFETLLKMKKRSLLKIQLETGRKHQIRVHCKAADCPIVGDPRYGKKNKHFLTLHAHQLEFVHPITEKKMTFEAKTPKWLELLLKQRGE